MSTFKTKAFDLFTLIECRLSSVEPTASKIWWLLRKPNFSLDIPFDNPPFHLFSRTFAPISYTIMQREIVLNSSKESRFYFLGINAMKVEFIVPRIHPFILHSFKAETKSSLISSKKASKKSKFNPSGPRLLDF